jgi:hypothetical protein
VAPGISTATSYILPIAAIDCDYDSVIGLPHIISPTNYHNPTVVLRHHLDWAVTIATPTTTDATAEERCCYRKQLT